MARLVNTWLTVKRAVVKRALQSRPAPFWIVCGAVVLCLLALRSQASTSNALTKLRDVQTLNIDEIVFAVRKTVPEHWYANFGYYAFKNPERKYPKLYRDGGRLCRVNLKTGQVTTLLNDPKGTIRDPQVNYAGNRILFSYRSAGSDHFHLYETGIDGSNLRQLTSGDCDDIEPSYLPDGGIVFVSSRCNRWVNCWLTQVAVLYRCDADGGNIRPISSNNEHDNTPWPLPDGRILYTRWEYVDRSQVHYHHLWVVNPDGTSQAVYYGNLRPGDVMIDAKPVPNSDRIVAIFSPGHGSTEHEGFVTIVDPNGGPDNEVSAQRIGNDNSLRDPWAFSENCIMAARHHSIVLLDGAGRQQEVFRLSESERSEGFSCHEPRPVVARTRETVVPQRFDPSQTNSHLILANVYEGRNMEGVRKGEIKKLLVLETLPKPINYTGGMDPLSYSGTFTLERILGTVPVSDDGSAYFEVPALRSLFFVALDENDLSVKRMQSFVTLQPGEVNGCVGCHEPRTRTATGNASRLQAMQRGAQTIQSVAGVPDVLDFPRDIQPVLNALCIDCHGYERTARGGPAAGKLILTGDRGPMFSHSYYMMTISGLFSDGRNQPVSNYAPRKLGSGASKILSMLDGTHYGVKADPIQKKMLRLWIDSGAPYPGTYAALGTGMIGGYAQNEQIDTDFDQAESKAAAEAIKARCASCHTPANHPLPSCLSDEIGLSFWRPDMDDPRLKTSRHIMFNLSRPETSVILLAPLAQTSGGWGICLDPKTGVKTTLFASTNDADYQKILGMIRAGKDRLERIKRFDMPGFQPRAEWIREMKRYGVLKTGEVESHIDVYATEQRYWRSLWYRPFPAASATRPPQ